MKIGLLWFRLSFDVNYNIGLIPIKFPSYREKKYLNRSINKEIRLKLKIPKSSCLNEHTDVHVLSIELFFSSQGT